MGHIGDFGTSHEPIDFTFGYFGTTIRVNPDFTMLALTDLLGALQQQMEEAKKALVKAQADGEDATEALAGAGSSGALGALRSMAVALIHPDDFDLFWELVKKHRQTMDDLQVLTTGLIEAVTDRPTVQPSSSSGGLSNTVTKSEVVSSSPAMDLLEGRPDLQVVFLRKDQELQERLAG